MDRKIWNAFISNLPGAVKHGADTDNAIDIWYSNVSDEIMCRDEKQAETLAKIIDTLNGQPVTEFGYYDPDQDEADDCVDDRTGWWMVRDKEVWL